MTGAAVAAAKRDALAARNARSFAGADLSRVRAAAGRRRTDRTAISARFRRPHDGVRGRRRRARSPGRLCRPDFLRPRGVRRTRRLRRRHTFFPRHQRRACCVAGRDRRVDAVCMAHRNCLSADQGRVFHHDHARLRPDGVFRRHVACPLRRRQRADHCGAQYHRRMAAAQERPGILLFHVPLPAGDVSVLPRAGRIALRPGAAGYQGERDQDGDDRLRRSPISAPRLCDHRRARRFRRISCSQI